MTNSNLLAYIPKVQKLVSTWNDLDKEKVKSAVMNIIKGGDGNTGEGYNPSLLNKIQMGLKYVNDKIHGTTDEMEYEAIPSDMRDDLSYISRNKINANGNKSKEALTKQANSKGVKLRESELEYLEQNPGNQSDYITIKSASSSIRTKEMSASIQNIVEDVESGLLDSKDKLKIRLWTILNVDNPSSLDSLVDNLWVDLHKDEYTSFEKGQKIKENYGELFGYDDRTGLEKAKEFQVGWNHRVYEEFANGISWLTRNIPEATVLGIAETASPLAVPLVLRGFSTKDVDEETADMVNTTRRTILGKGIYDAFKKIDEPFENYADEVKETFSTPYAVSFGNDYVKSKEKLDTTASNRGEWRGGLTVEVLSTEMIGSVLGELRGGTTTVNKLLTSDDRWAKFLYKFAKNGLEGATFSVVNNAGEDMGENVLTWELLGLGGEALMNKLGNGVKTRAVKSLTGKKIWDKMVTTAREQGKKSLGQAKKQVVETIFNYINEKGASGERIAEYREEVLNLLGKDKTEILKSIPGTHKSVQAEEILNELFGLGERETKEYKSRLYNALDNKSERPREEIDKLWDELEALYKGETKEFTAEQLEKIRWTSEFVNERMNAKGDSTLKNSSAQIWTAWINPLRDTIENLEKSAFGGKGQIHDLNLLISILSSAKGGVQSKMGETFWDRLKDKGLSTLTAGALGALWGDYLTDGEMGTPSPYLIAMSLLALRAGATSPESLSTFINLFSKKLSNAEMAGVLKSIEDGTLAKSTGKEFLRQLSKVLMTDTFDYFVDRFWGKDTYTWENLSEKGEDSLYELYDYPELYNHDEDTLDIDIPTTGRKRLRKSS